MRLSAWFVVSIYVSGLAACGGGEEERDGGTTGMDGGTLRDGGNSGVDSGRDAGSDSGGGGSDAGPVDAGGPNGVMCFGAPRDCLPGEVCCEDPETIACLDDCVGFGLRCDGTEDCPGQLCCITGNGTECRDTCEGQRACHDSMECEDG